MSLSELEEPWGQLVSLGLATEERIPIVGREFTIGRGKDSDLVVENKCVSSLHCVLSRSDSGELWIKDLSTNGTIVGNRIVRREEKLQLKNGDVIKLVHRKDQPNQDVVYRFIDLTCLSSEESTFEKTQEYIETKSIAVGMKRISESRDIPPPKRRAEVGVEVGKEIPVENKIAQSKVCEVESSELPTKPKKSAEPTPSEETPKTTPSEEAPKTTPSEETPKTTPSEETPKTTPSEETPKTTPSEETPKTTPSEETPKTTPSEETPKTTPSEEAPKPISSEDPPKPALIQRDSMEESLLCGICQEILHDCVSLQPCMHSYCAGCYSDWMAMSDKCPACRNTVERIGKNHIVNNLAMAYLKANPDKRRSEEYLKELDEKNKITKDMLYPKRKSRVDSDEEGTDEGTSEESDESVGSVHPLAPFMFHTTPYSLFPLIMPPPPTRCRQCPGYSEPFIGSTHPPPLTYTCPVDGNHVLCTCCTQPMPDRRSDSTCPRPQKCELCGNAYCHMYWGCRKIGCRGCLNCFKDIDLDESHLTDLISGNLFESKILKDYLTAKKMTIKDLCQVCCARLADHTYCATDPRLRPETHTCYKCALKAFQELAYSYRRDIPSDELPVSITARPNCYWGRMCRTQRSKPQHAENFNHICEQTRHL